MLLLISWLHAGADRSRLFNRSLAMIEGMGTAKKKTKLRARRTSADAIDLLSAILVSQ
jgi:hypothetical protein